MRSGRTGAGYGDYDDDDMPQDIDAFRRELARKIRAFVESRAGPAALQATEGPAAL